MSSSARTLCKGDEMKHRILLIILLLFSISMIWGQSEARYIKSETGGFPIMVSSVQVLDSSQEPISTLKEPNFSITLDGKNAESLKVSNYEESGMGLQIMLCVDSSGSMSGVPINAFKKAIIPFVNKLRTVDKLAISTFGDDYQLLADFSNEKNLLKRTLENITPRSNYTALYYGSYKALQHLVANDEQPGKVLILVSDGKDENPASSYDENDVINLAKENGIPIFAMGYSRVQEIFLQSLERMAEKTGGDFYHASKTEEFQDYFEKVYRQIMNIYLLSYTVPGMNGDGNDHNLGIKVSTPYNTTHQLKASVTLPITRNQVAQKTTKKSSNIWVIVGVIALILVVGAVAYMLINKATNKRKAEEARRLNELEAAKERELAAERRKAEELEERLKQKDEKLETDVFRPAAAAPEPAFQPRVVPEDRERTIITGGTSFVPRIENPQSLRMEFMFGSQSGKIYTIGKEGATIGRKEGNSIVISDQTVSSYHAKISYIDGAFIIEDLGSTNGVFINGNRVQIHKITDSCTFKFGEAEGDFDPR